MEKQFKNYKTFEEAKTIWENSVKSLKSDHVVFYVVPPEEDEESKIIGVETEADMADLEMKFKILAVGEKVEDPDIKAGVEVVIHPAAQRTVFPVFLGDCGYTLMGSSMVVAVLN